MKTIKKTINTIAKTIYTGLVYAFYALPVIKVGFHKDIEFTDPTNPWKK